MNRNLIILQLQKRDTEKRIQKLNSNINNENKIVIRKIINKLNNELDNINYELEKIGGIK